MNGADKLRPEGAPRLSISSRVLSHGLPALVIGGALMLAAIWLATLELTGMLARVQVETRMAHVAEKVGEVMQNHAGGVLSEETTAALSHLEQFLNVQHMELLDASGRVLWHGETAPHPAVQPPAPGKTVIERHMVDGMSRVIARHYANLETPGGTLHLLLMADVTDVMAGYRRIGMLLAKAFSSVVLVAIFLMGWMLILRWREQRALMAEIRMVLQSARGEGDESAQLRALLDQAAEHNATLLRQMLAVVQAAEERGRHATRAADSARTGEARRMA